MLVIQDFLYKIPNNGLSTPAFGAPNLKNKKKLNFWHFFNLTAYMVKLSTFDYYFGHKIIHGCQFCKVKNWLENIANHQSCNMQRIFNCSLNKGNMPPYPHLIFILHITAICKLRNKVKDITSKRQISSPRQQKGEEDMPHMWTTSHKAKANL